MADTVPENLDDIINELRGAVNDATATAGFAGFGLRKLTEFIMANVRPNAVNQDPTIFLGIGDPNDPASEQYSAWRRSEALDQIRRNGPVDDRIGQQWIVMLYARWDEEFRLRLARAYGCDARDIKVPLLGDLRKLRHGVVHNKGKSYGYGDVLHWFGVDEPITLRGKHYAEFHRRFPWDDLRVGPSTGATA